MYFYMMENFVYEEINEGSFSNPHPRVSIVASMLGSSCNNDALPQAGCSIWLVAWLGHDNLELLLLMDLLNSRHR